MLAKSLYIAVYREAEKAVISSSDLGASIFQPVLITVFKMFSQALGMIFVKAEKLTIYKLLLAI